MRKTFEELAIDIVRLYINARTKQNEISNYNSWDIAHDYELNNLDNMTTKVIDVANQLADNYRNRVEAWDEKSFNREVEKMLTEDNNVN